MVGGMGQAGFYGPLLKPYFPAWLAAVGFMFPLLIVFALTFFKRPFLRPGPFCLCLLFAMCWYALITILAEILAFRGSMPPESPQYAFRLCRALMHVGWLGFIPLIYYYRLARKRIPHNHTF